MECQIESRSQWAQIARSELATKLRCALHAAGAKLFSPKQLACFSRRTLVVVFVVGTDGESARRILFQ